MLNSERITRAFGSYGVDVLTMDGQRRVSSLFSGAGEQKITRTYAVVDFVEPRPAEIAPVHDAIRRGESIGATFRHAGWQVGKRHLYIGKFDIPAVYQDISALMKIELPDTLATHAYVLSVSRNGQTIDYARITEIHHPDYLTADDLRNIYGEILFDHVKHSRVQQFIGPPNRAK